MQLDYYKLLAKTSSYILSFVYKARKRVISKDSTPITNKQVLKLPRDKHIADLGPKLSNSSNTTTKLSRDFYSKEGPRPPTTTSTTIVDTRNGKGSSRTSIINSSLVPKGFSDSDFAEDKATSKST
ncbi:hypothetical protein P8C59_000237 [Phyllachora maydis]|uniref:Uncharacterized protein n=1 Tax=Phyllachora maydis TaxID=1825666 RepID=A0AAD9HVH7_9PEZI|nr:hypothetical protein P8C59_000237 [Phyllachora maydis]